MALSIINRNKMQLKKADSVDSTTKIVSSRMEPPQTSVSARITALPFDPNFAASFLTLQQLSRAQHHFTQTPSEALTKPSNRSPPSRLPFNRRNYRSSNCDSHAEERKYVCDHCGDSFSYKHVLQNHVRTHTGEKPFVCKEPGCDKRFTRDHHLKTHMRLHTGEKPFPCDYCDKRFVQVANLRRHLRTHTKEPSPENPSDRKELHPAYHQLSPHHSRSPPLLAPPIYVPFYQCPTYQYKVQDEPEDLSLKSRLPVS